MLPPILLPQLWVQKQGACSRQHVLLPATPVLDLSPVTLANQRVTTAENTVRQGSTSKQQASSTGNTTLSLTPDTLAQSGLTDAGENAKVLVVPGSSLLAPVGRNGSKPPGGSNAAAATSSAPLQWPPPGGQLISCPVALRGTLQGQQQQQGGGNTQLDVAFQRDMFRLAGPAQVPKDAATVGAGAAAAAAAGMSSSGGVLQLQDLTLVQLPQGAGLESSTGGGSAGPVLVRPAVPVGAAAAGSSNTWASVLPGQAFTHLLWFAQR